MNIRGQVQGFAIGAAVMAAVMIGGPMLFSAHAPITDSTQIAKSFGVNIVWNIAGCKVNMQGAEGCFFPVTPNTIYVSPDLPPEHERFIVLHEITHVIQHRLGMPMDECQADQVASFLGSFGAHYCSNRQLLPPVELESPAR